MIIQKNEDGFVTQEIKQIMKLLPSRINLSNIGVLIIATIILGCIVFVQLPVMQQIDNSKISYLDKGRVGILYNVVKVRNIQAGSRIRLTIADKNGRRHFLETHVLEIKKSPGETANAIFILPPLLDSEHIQLVSIETRHLSIIKQIWS